MAARTTIRTPMPIKMRAKQFMMFDAMKGLTEAIAEKEQQNYPRKDLAEDRINEINRCLLDIQVGDQVSVNYYYQYGMRYKQLVGTVSRIDFFRQEIQIGDETVCFSEVDAITSENGIQY